MKKLLIVGGGSRIAREFAILAAHDGWTISLAGRDLQEMELSARDIQIRVHGSRVEALRMDLASPVLPDFLREIFPPQCSSCGLFIAAGSMPSEVEMAENPEKLSQSVIANYLGPASLIDRFLPVASQKAGSFVSCLTSVAGDRGRPSNFRYGSTKAALSTYLQGLRCSADKNLLVQDVKLGPVNTPLNSGNTRAPMMIPPAKAALQVWDAILKKKAKIYVPRRWHLIMGIIRALPDPVMRAARL